MIEAKTYREFAPKLVDASWGAAESVVVGQHRLTNGRTFVAGGKVRGGKQIRADYLHRYRSVSSVAAVEARELGLPAESGVEQARGYAEMHGATTRGARHGE